MCADAQLQGSAPLHRCKNLQHCGTSHATSTDRSHRRVTASHCTADQAVLPSHVARLALWHTQRSAGGCSLAATQCVPQWRLDLRRVTLAHSDRHSCASSDQLELYCAAPGELFLTAVEKDGMEAGRPGRSRFKLNSSFPNHADSDRTMLSGRRQRRVIAAQAAPGGRLGWTLDRPV